MSSLFKSASPKKRGWSARLGRSKEKSKSKKTPATCGAASEKGDDDVLELLNNEPAADTSVMETEPVKALASAFDSAASSGGASLKVFLRLRPTADGQEPVIHPQDDTVVRAVAPAPLNQKKEYMDHREYSFTRVLQASASQDEVYESTVAPIVTSFLESGTSGLVFTYGVTGSGKSYTMLGTKDQPGIVPRAVSAICSSTETDGEQHLALSYLEIYNEQIFDLLGKKTSKKLDLRDRAGRPEVSGLSRHPIACATDAVQLISRGSKNRHRATTNLNADSSRSHCVCSLELGTTTLWLVDLAGSERNDRTGAQMGSKKQNEANSINTSLFTLMACLGNLRSSSSATRLNANRFRESKLTRLLAPHLSGKRGAGATAMIVNASPAAADFVETCHVMNQAAKCTKIKVVAEEGPSREAAMLAAANMTDTNGRRVRPATKRAADKSIHALDRDSNSGPSRQRVGSDDDVSRASSLASDASSSELRAQNRELRDEVILLKERLETIEMQVREECSAMMQQFMPQPHMGLSASDHDESDGAPLPPMASEMEDAAPTRALGHSKVLASAKKKKHQDDVCRVIDDLKDKCDDLEEELATAQEENTSLRARLEAYEQGLDDVAPPEKWMLLDHLLQLCQAGRATSEGGDADSHSTVADVEDLQQQQEALEKALRFSTMSPLRRVADQFGFGFDNDDASTKVEPEALASAVRNALFPEDERKLLRDVCESEALEQLTAVHNELRAAKQSAAEWESEAEQLRLQLDSAVDQGGIVSMDHDGDDQSLPMRVIEAPATESQLGVDGSDLMDEGEEAEQAQAEQSLEMQDQTGDEENEVKHDDDEDEEEEDDDMDFMEDKEPESNPLPPSIPPKSPLVMRDVNSPTRAPPQRVVSSKKFSPGCLSRTNERIRLQAAQANPRPKAAPKPTPVAGRTRAAARTRSSVRVM